MKSWENLNADIDRWLNVHFSEGRSGADIEFIVIHYNAGNLSVDGIWNVWQTREASAHYQVTADGTIGQLVHDWDTAWHAGSWDANIRSIGIEHANMEDGTVTEATLDNGAHLVAALCHAYGLGSPRWGVNVFPHNNFIATSCPGALGGSQRDEYMARANAYYNGGAPTPPPIPSGPRQIAVDGWWGSDTTRRLQEILGTPVDGVISGQYAGNQEFYPAAGTGWDWSDGGSQLIIAMQRAMGIEADGYAGPGFAKARQ